jgi:hypothetical protein
MPLLRFRSSSATCEISLTGNNGLSDLLFLVDECNYWAGQELVALQCNGGWGTTAFISERLCLTFSRACIAQSEAERGHSGMGIIPSLGINAERRQSFGCNQLDF